MSNMFFTCISFDCDLGNWDVSNVEDIAFMFFDCKNFTGKGLEQWNPVKFLNLKLDKRKKQLFYIFYGCDSLNLKQTLDWYTY